MARISVPVPKAFKVGVKNTFISVEIKPDDGAGSGTCERRHNSLPRHFEFKFKEPEGEMTYQCSACHMVFSFEEADKLQRVCGKCSKPLDFRRKARRLETSFNKVIDVNEKAPKVLADVLNRVNKVRKRLEGKTVCLAWKLDGMDCKSHFREKSSDTHVLSHWIEDAWFFYGGQVQDHRVRIGLYPIDMVQGRGGSSFRASGGWACLKVFIEGNLPEDFPKKFRASISVGGQRNDERGDEVVSFTQSPVPFFESAEEFYIPNALEIDILGRMSLDISVQLTPA